MIPLFVSSWLSSSFGEMGERRIRRREGLLSIRNVNIKGIQVPNCLGEVRVYEVRSGACWNTFITALWLSCLAFNCREPRLIPIWTASSPSHLFPNINITPAPVLSAAASSFSSSLFFLSVHTCTGLDKLGPLHHHLFLQISPPLWQKWAVTTRPLAPSSINGASPPH